MEAKDMCYIEPVVSWCELWSGTVASVVVGLLLNIIGCVTGILSACWLADVDISDSCIVPICIRQYTLHAIMLTTAAYGYTTSSGKAAGIPGVNVKTVTTIPEINVVLKNSYNLACYSTNKYRLHILTNNIPGHQDRDSSWMLGGTPPNIVASCFLGALMVCCMILEISARR